MSFDLPRRPVSLRFTGEMKALDPKPKESGNGLGQTRPKAPPPSRAVPRSVPPPPKSVAPPPLPQRKPDAYVADMQPTPYVGGRPSERAELVAAMLPAAIAAKAPEMRVQLSSISDDDRETEALDRGEMGLPSVMRSGAGGANAPASVNAGANLEILPPAAKPNPWAHQRAPDSAPPPPEKAAVIPPKPVEMTAGGPLSWPAWIAIAIMAAIASYTFAPAAFTSIERATGLLEPREPR